MDAMWTQAKKRATLPRNPLAESELFLYVLNLIGFYLIQILLVYLSVYQ